MKVSSRKRAKRGFRTNPRRKKLLAGIARGMNISEAGRVAGYGTAQAAHKAFNAIQKQAPEVFDKINLPAEKLLKHLLRQLDATKVHLFTYKGIVRDRREVPDHDVQLRALIQLAKILGLYPKSGSREKATEEERNITIEFRLPLKESPGQENLNSDALVPK